MELKAETRERIRLTAQELGYFRNEIARSMATGRNDVIAFVSCDTGTWEYTGKKHIPYASVNLSSASAGIGVTSDDFQGTRDAVKYLAGLGHRRISYISNKSRLEFTVNRENGFIAGMKEHVSDSGK